MIFGYLWKIDYVLGVMTSEAADFEYVMIMWIILLVIMLVGLTVASSVVIRCLEP